MKEIYSYAQRIKNECGKGYKPRGLEQKEKDVFDLKTRALALTERVMKKSEEIKKNPKGNIASSEMTQLLDKAEEAREKYENAKQALFYGDAFDTDMPGERVGLVSCEGEINLVDVYGIRHDMNTITGNKNGHIVVENYNDTTTYLANEGESIPHKDISDCVHVIKTDYNSIKKIAGILDVPEDMLSDDTDLLNGAIDSVQKKHRSNTETMLLCRAIQVSKEAINIDVVSLSSVVNCHLRAKAKLLTEIITNESGFTKLDITDGAGNPLVKKNFTQGEFVYGDKYVIRVLSDDILPNNEDGSSPIFIGDWRNVLRLVIVKKYPPLIKVDAINCSVENRAITYTIPILTTKSDKAFIVGYIN